MSRVLTCPACGARQSDGVEFTAQQQVDSYRELLVTGLTPTGALTVEGVDHTYGDPRGPLRISCNACKHEWPTTREVAW